MYEFERANSQLISAITLPNNSPIVRNGIWYKADIGYRGTALTVKNYIKSVFGANSLQYKSKPALVYKFNVNFVKILPVGACPGTK